VSVRNENDAVRRRLNPRRLNVFRQRTPRPNIGTETLETTVAAASKPRLFLGRDVLQDDLATASSTAARMMDGYRRRNSLRSTLSKLPTVVVFSPAAPTIR